jgi:predicted NBD/HSP70 family sugar kinase
LASWNNVPIRNTLEKEFNVPVAMAHDAGAIGLAEFFEGAGRGATICAYITVSTGVGGDRITQGSIDVSTYNPEIGSQLVNGEKWEQLISGTAVKKKYGIEPWELDSIDERNALADILAQGLYNTCLHWSPDTIVLGGSMIVGKNPIPIDRVQETLVKMLTMYPKAPVIKMAQLGDNGGLVGGAILAEKLLSTGIK